MQLTRQFTLLTTFAAVALSCHSMFDNAQEPLVAAANNQCLCPCDGSDGGQNIDAIGAIIDGIIAGGPIRFPNVDGSQSATVDEGAWALRPNSGFYIWLNWLSATAGSHISTTGQRVCLDEGELRWLISLIANHVAFASTGGSGGDINMGSGGWASWSGSVGGAGHAGGNLNAGSRPVSTGGGSGNPPASGGGQTNNPGGGQTSSPGASSGGQTSNPGGGQTSNPGASSGGQTSNPGGGQTSNPDASSGGHTDAGFDGSMGGSSNDQAASSSGGSSGGYSGGGFNTGDSSTSLGRGACFKIIDIRSGKPWGTHGAEYAASMNPKVFSVFKAYPVQGGWTFDEVRRQGRSMSKPVHITSKNQISGNHRGQQAVFTLSSTNFGRTCIGLRGYKMERRSDWTRLGWGDNYRASYSGADCADVDIVESGC